MEKSPTTPEVNNLLQDKKTELENLREIKLKGNMIRSRVQWLIEGEKPTNYFCGLENKNYVDKTIKKVINEDQNTITDQKEILDEVRTYYKKLFSNQDKDLQDIDLNDIIKNDNVKRLSEVEKQSIEGDITIIELGDALKNMNNNKSPGSDGFPADFYKVFWSKLKYFIFRAINESYEKQLCYLLHLDNV